MILAIDPGNEESAYVVVEDDLSSVIDKDKANNHYLQDLIYSKFSGLPITNVAIEMVASYGMAVGKEVFETCVWIGKFEESIIRALHTNPIRIFRKDEKMCLCFSMKARDSNIRQALIDRFGSIGVKKNPGYFYGFKKDMWAAMAVAVAYHDLYLADKTICADPRKRSAEEDSGDMEMEYEGIQL